MKKQPDPKPAPTPNVTDLVVEDLQARHKKGLEVYNTPLQPFNGRDGLQDAYEELLDAALYLRQVMYEQEDEETYANLREEYTKLSEMYVQQSMVVDVLGQTLERIYAITWDTNVRAAITAGKAQARLLLEMPVGNKETE